MWRGQRRSGPLPQTQAFICSRGSKPGQCTISIKLITTYRKPMTHFMLLVLRYYCRSALLCVALAHNTKQHHVKALRHSTIERETWWTRPLPNFIWPPNYYFLNNYQHPRELILCWTHTGFMKALLYETSFFKGMAPSPKIYHLWPKKNSIDIKKI